MIYAAGLNYLAMAFWFMAIGIIVYIKARYDKRKQNSSTEAPEPFFSTAELVAAMLIIVIAVAALVWRTDQDQTVKKQIHKWSQQIEQDIEQL
jgi:TRAP-type C4-dicarboxylate transport system permease large subunit